MPDEWRSPFEQGGLGTKIRRLGLELLARLLALAGLRVQARMNIDPASCWHDPKFAATFGAYQLSNENEWDDPSDSVRHDLLRLLASDVEAREVSGSVAEVGVRHGMSAKVLMTTLPFRSFLLIDTGNGFMAADLDTDLSTTGQTVRQSFAPNRQRFERFWAAAHRWPNVRVFEGDIATFAGFDDGERFAFVHIDVDLYRPTAAALAMFGPRMSAGGFILVHDYNAWPGARAATDAFLKTDSGAKSVVPMPDKSGTVVLTF